MLVSIHNRPEKLIQFHSICEKTQAKSPYNIKCIRYKWLGGKGDVKNSFNKLPIFNFSIIYF